MGLREHIAAGAKLRRTNVTFTAAGTGQVTFPPAAAILSVSSSAPVRLRLYDDVASRDDGGESSRVFTADPNQNIAIVADISMSAAGQYTLDPIMYATPLTDTLLYRVDAGTSQITLNIYPLESASIVTETAITNKRTLPATTSTGGQASGSLTGTSIPKTYALISASLNTGIGRLRLYTNEAAIDNATEKSRTFVTEAPASVGLIVDAIITASEGSFQFFPKLIGANLNTIGSDLPREDISGENEIYYIIDKISGTGNISASLHVFSFED